MLLGLLLWVRFGGRVCSLQVVPRSVQLRVQRVLVGVMMDAISVGISY
jgi:hypothetical protein